MNAAAGSWEVLSTIGIILWPEVEMFSAADSIQSSGQEWIVSASIEPSLASRMLPEYTG